MLAVGAVCEASGLVGKFQSADHLPEGRLNSPRKAEAHIRSMKYRNDAKNARDDQYDEH